MSEELKKRNHKKNETTKGLKEFVQSYSENYLPYFQLYLSWAPGWRCFPFFNQNVVLYSIIK